MPKGYNDGSSHQPPGSGGRQKIDFNKRPSSQQGQQPASGQKNSQPQGPKMPSSKLDFLKQHWGKTLCGVLVLPPLVYSWVQVKHELENLSWYHPKVLFSIADRTLTHLSSMGSTVLDYTLVPASNALVDSGAIDMKKRLPGHAVVCINAELETKKDAGDSRAQAFAKVAYAQVNREFALLGTVGAPFYQEHTPIDSAMPIPYARFHITDVPLYWPPNTPYLIPKPDAISANAASSVAVCGKNENVYTQPIKFRAQPQ